MKRTLLFAEGDTLSGKAKVLGVSGKGMGGFFAQIEKLKAEAAAQQKAKQQ